LPPEIILFGLCLVAVLAIARLATWNPLVGLLVWVSFLPLQLDTVGALGIRLAPSDLILAGLTTAAAFRLLKQRPLVPQMDDILRATLILLGWLCVASISTMLSVGHMATYVVINKLLGFASLVLTYVIVRTTLGPIDMIRQALHWYCIVGSVWNLLGLGGYALWKWGGILSPMIYHPHGEDRLQGFLLDPNAYAGFVVSVALVQLAIGARPLPGYSTRVAVLNSALLLLGIFLADSRSAWLAMTCGVVALALHVALREHRRILIPCLLLGTISVGFLWLSLQSDLRDNSLVERMDLVHLALASVASSPLWGSGLGWHDSLIHSTYLWLLAETGLIGFMLLGTFLIGLYIRIRIAWNSADSQTLQVGLAGVAVLGGWMGLMIGLESLYQRHYWYLMAVVCSASWADRSGTSSSRKGR
jgi:hypothetical protein